MDSESLFSVKGKNVLITGGAKGIGRMIAEGFVRNGAAAVFLTGRDAASCDQAVSELQPLAAPGASVVAMPANLQHLSECQKLAASLTERLSSGGGLHVLVNNAGATWGEPYDNYPDAAWSKLMTLNVQRVFSLTQLCTPLLERAARPGDPARVIHIGSIDGLRVPPMATFAYSASKAALHHLSRSLARELGPRGITSNVLACGPFPSKMMRATLESVGDVMREEIPLKRIGEPEDVAGASLFLASRAGAFCTGALIRVDGGASILAKI